MVYVINCPCGYSYQYDLTYGWKGKEPKIISRDLKLLACPECGTVYYDINNFY